MDTESKKIEGLTNENQWRRDKCFGGGEGKFVG